MAEPADVWASGDAYEPYVGRWSRRVTAEFLAWLSVPPGCGGFWAGRWTSSG
jgi:hypothetical protein